MSHQENRGKADQELEYESVKNIFLHAAKNNQINFLTNFLMNEGFTNSVRLQLFLLYIREPSINPVIVRLILAATTSKSRKFIHHKSDIEILFKDFFKTAGNSDVWKTAMKLLMEACFDESLSNFDVSFGDKPWLAEWIVEYCFEKGISVTSKNERSVGKGFMNRLRLAKERKDAENRESSRPHRLKNFLDMLKEEDPNPNKLSETFIQMMKSQVNVVKDEEGSSLLVQFLDKLRSLGVKAQVDFLKSPFLDDQSSSTLGAQSGQDEPQRMIELAVIQEHLHCLDIKGILHYFVDRKERDFFDLVKDSCNKINTDLVNGDFIRFQNLCELQFRILERLEHYDNDPLTKNRAEKISVCHHLVGILHKARKNYFLKTATASDPVASGGAAAKDAGPDGGLAEFLAGTKGVTQDVLEKARAGKEVNSFIEEMNSLLGSDSQKFVIISAVKSLYPDEKGDWSDLLRRGLKSSVKDKKRKAEGIVCDISRLPVKDIEEFLSTPKGSGLVKKPLLADKNLSALLEDNTIKGLIDHAIEHRNLELCGQLKRAVDQPGVKKKSLVRRWQIAGVLIRLYHLYDAYQSHDTRGNDIKAKVCRELIYHLSGRDLKNKKEKKPSVIDHDHINLKDYLVQLKSEGGLRDAIAGTTSELGSILKEIQSLNHFVVRSAQASELSVFSDTVSRSGSESRSLAADDESMLGL